MFSAFRRNTGGSFFANTQRISAATIAKLIHLKISLKCSVEVAAPSSAAYALCTLKRNSARHTATLAKIARNRVIERLAPNHPDRLGFEERGSQFRQPIGRCQFQGPGVPQPLLRRSSLSPRPLPPKPLPGRP